MLLMWSFIMNLQPMMIADVDDLSGISVSREDDLSQRVELRLKDPDREVRLYVIIVIFVL